MPRIGHLLSAALFATCLASVGVASAQAPAPSPTPEAQRQAYSDFCTQLRNARTPAERRALMHRMRDIRGPNEAGGMRRHMQNGRPGAMMDRPSWRAMREMGCLDEPAGAGVVTPKIQGGVTYVSGGVGQDEVEAMHRIARDYSVRLTFVGKGGEYLSDIDTHIRTARGAAVLAVVSEGPLLYVRLPSGSYRVSASYNGEEKQTTITVPAHGAVVHTMAWPH
ncbi:hypothetical protein [Ralstonia sp. UBA689]|uniref:hypothetical protein n=1 Tax=Ralstonia sp. UBA689 TaxID=1947373 RepID=UPI0025DD5CE9|nr:hypothetical protein [Ralstonia sp. UBA689]